MLNYHEQYQIVNGIFYAFSKNSTKRILNVNHTQKKIDSMKSRFPHYKFEQFTKENFIVLNLYINFKLSPSSVEDVLKHLLELEFNTDVLPFKNAIVRYREVLSAHIKYLRETYGKPSTEEIFEAYRKKKIEFYTLWFYLIYTGHNLYHEIDVKMFGRANSRELQKIKNILLYVTFSEKSLEYIKLLLDESDLLDA